LLQKTPLIAAFRFNITQMIYRSVKQMGPFVVVLAFAVWQALFLLAKQPDGYLATCVLLQCDANILGYAAGNDEANSNKCLVASGRCNGPHNKAKHDLGEY